MPRRPKRLPSKKFKKKELRGNSTERGYNYTWQKSRESFLRSHPLCVKCLDDDFIKCATVVDHIKPHKGNKEMFWDMDNWQALCKTCHDKKTAEGL